MLECWNKKRRGQALREDAQHCPLYGEDLG